MKKLMLFAAAACGLASAANAWTCTSPANGFTVTASMVPAPHGQDALRVALAAEDGEPVAAKLHAWFIDSDGLILAGAPLSQPSAKGMMLVGSTATTVPETAKTLVVLVQPTEASSAHSIVTQFTLPGGI